MHHHRHKDNIFCSNKINHEKRLRLKHTHKKDRKKYVRILKRLLFDTSSTYSDLSSISLLSDNSICHSKRDLNTPRKKTRHDEHDENSMKNHKK